MRTYKRKTARGLKSLEVYEMAALEVEKNRSFRDVANEFQLCYVSLFKFIKKKKTGAPAEVGYKKPRLVFSREQESTIAEYLLKCANIYFGLLPSEVKKLAHQCASFYNIKNVPASWKVNKMAGNDWFTCFMKRNPMLSIRTPEATSLSRATSFNRTNVHLFFEKYRSVLKRYSFNPSRIWNVDETGITTVQKPKKIVAGKGLKQVGAATSAERGVLVTLAVAVNAIGNAIPPMFVFPRIRYNDMFVKNGPSECIGVGNKSGWMAEKEFLQFLDHFIRHVKPSKEDPVVLLLDNHGSHVNVEVINKAKTNNIILVSFPPHCSHRLQPLDVGVYGPLKNYMSRAQTTWMTHNPGKTMSIYNLPGIVRDALPLVLNPMNVINAFKKSGIWPCNEDVFQESDFAPSFVTDRPNCGDQTQSFTTKPPVNDLSLDLENPEVLNDKPNLDTSITEVIAQMSNKPVAGPSGMQKDFLVETIRPLPKAPARVKINRRRTRKAAILTDTPEQNTLAKECLIREIKRRKRTTTNQKKEKNNKNISGKGKSKGKEHGKIKLTNKKVKKLKKRILEESNDSEENQYFCILCGASYNEDISGGDWIQCISCKEWAQSDCIKGDTTSFTCFNCVDNSE